jgi:hypothetical protein
VNAMAAHSAKFGLSVVTKLRQRLVQAPDREVAEVSKQGVIDRLIPELRALHAKGYPWHSIASLLAEEGVQISGTALGAYVRRGSSTGAAKKGRSKRKPLPAMIDAAAEVPASTVAAPRSQTPRAAVAPEASPTAPRTPAQPSSDAQAPALGSPRSSFTPRRHSGDI